MPHVRHIVKDFENNLRALLSSADIKALSLTEAPLFVLLRIVPALERPEHTSSTAAEASGSAPSSSGN
eukprot:5422481-Karenia_brevis.AAC.1